jgi:predicted DNA-binding transcriptional regulator YafY
MHAANPDKSERLARMLRAIKAHPNGVSTMILQRLTDSCAVHTDIAELRENGYRIDRRRGPNTLAGRHVNIYTYRGRNVAGG